MHKMLDFTGDPEAGRAFVKERAAQLGRSCGTCSLCCKVIEVTQIGKPANKWCKHCKPGKGCMIYEDRPPMCKAFSCLWLINDCFDDKWKPTHSHMVIVADGEGLSVNVDPDYSNIWQQPHYFDDLVRFAHSVQVRLIIKGRWFAVAKTGDVIQY